MIDNRRLTTERHNQQDWPKAILARLTSMLQGQRDLGMVGAKLLSELVPVVNAHQGLIYQMDNGDVPRLKLLASYANDDEDGHPATVPLGAGFIGQCAADKRRILIPEIPPDTVRVGSAIFQALPKSLAVFPVMFENEIKAVIALASLHQFDDGQLMFLDQFTSSVGIVFNSIEATMQTEELLQQSQQLATELQTQKRELQQT